ncbi:MAG: FecR domain-containing protein [Polyangiaceae bacterium]
MEDHDFKPWQPQLPSRDFAERVLERVRQETAGADMGDAPSEVGPGERPAPGPDEGRRSAERRRRAWVGIGVAAGFTLAFGSLAAFRAGRLSSSAGGEYASVTREEVRMDGRATLVMEPGAHVAWSGDDVLQDRGDVFYRVERGSKFKVHTPRGDVEVLGTCFRVKVRNSAFVGVYEGKVSVSRASTVRVLGPGEALVVGPEGTFETDTVDALERRFESDSRTAESALADANKNLVENVRAYKDRLGKMESERAALEKDLRAAEDRLRAASGDASSRASLDPFDLRPEDWAELAREGAVKFKIPCVRLEGWTPAQDLVDKYRLNPEDVKAIHAAYVRSSARVWADVKPLCAKIVGSPEVAEIVGPEACGNVILTHARKTDENAAIEAQRVVGEIRAGMRPPPSATDTMSPKERYLLVMTGEMKSFEDDLAKTFGVDEAHRLAFDDAMCTTGSHIGGPGPRK